MNCAFCVAGVIPQVARLLVSTLEAAVRDGLAMPRNAAGLTPLEVEAARVRRPGAPPLAQQHELLVFLAHQLARRSQDARNFAARMRAQGRIFMA